MIKISSYLFVQKLQCWCYKDDAVVERKGEKNKGSCDRGDAVLLSAPSASERRSTQALLGNRLPLFSIRAEIFTTVPKSYVVSFLDLPMLDYSLWC